MSILGSVLNRTLQSRHKVLADNRNVIKVTAQQNEGGVIIAFFAASEGDALLEHTKWSLAPLEKLASKVVAINLNQSNWLDLLTDALSEPVWFAAGFFGAGQEIQTETGNFWVNSHIPFIRYYGDLPAYFPDRHIHQHPNSINVYGDHSQTAFYRRWFDNPALSFTHPPLVLDTMPIDLVDVDKKKKGLIVFPKNGNSPKALRDYWQISLPSSVSKALNEMAEESMCSDKMNGRPHLDDLVVEYFRHLDLDIGSDRATLCFLVAQLDDFMRRIKSTMVAEALLDLPVIIRGRFWDHIDFRGKKANYDPDSNVARTQAIIDQSPAIIDMSPNTQDIPHDRVRRSIGRGTAFLTNRMECFSNQPIREDKFTYHFTPDSIKSLVEYYVTRPSEAIELGIEQSRVFREKYRHEHTAQVMACAVNLVAMRLAGRPAGTQNFVHYPPLFYR